MLVEVATRQNDEGKVDEPNKYIDVFDCSHVDFFTKKSKHDCISKQHPSFLYSLRFKVRLDVPILKIIASKIDSQNKVKILALTADKIFRFEVSNTP